MAAKELSAHHPAVAAATHGSGERVIDRRAFIITGIAALAAPVASQAQQAATVQRIGYLGSGSATGSSRFIDAFRRGLGELGWFEGQNIVIEYRFAEGRFDRLPDLAAGLVRLNMDVIVAAPTPAAVAAKNATSTIPIVMMAVADPVQLGLVTSLARPGGNVTGLSFSVDLSIFGKALELLNETIPKLRRVAVLWNPANPLQAAAIRDVKTAAQSLGLQLQLLQARGPEDFDGAFAKIAKERVGALLVVTDSMFILHRARLADLSARHRLPSMYGVREQVEAGGLMSYGPNLAAVYRRAAFFVDRIFKGTKTGDLPVEQPTAFELTVNLKTAKALGLTIPPSLLLRADQLIE